MPWARMHFTGRVAVLAFTLLFCVLLVPSLCGCSNETASGHSQLDANEGYHDASGDWVNAGRPKSPVPTQDWFEAGAGKEESSCDIDSVMRRTDFDMLMRYADSTDATVCAVYENPETLSDGSVVPGYSFKFGDRIQLTVIPTDRPFDLDYELENQTSQSPNTLGETHPWRRASVRGFPGIRRDAGIQKWANGDEIQYPAVIEWVEPTQGSVPYIRYALVGDVPVGTLQAVASSDFRVLRGRRP